jgi:hypothetical protein
MIWIFNRELFILIWKNWILTKRTRTSIGELVTPLVFVLILCIMRLAIDTHTFDEQNNRSNDMQQNIFDINPRRNKIIFYPNSNLTRRLMENTKGLLVNSDNQRQSNLGKLSIESGRTR